MFNQVNQNQSFPELELRVLEKWKKEDTFKKSLDNRKDCQKSVFFDGPPFANGMPHYGHILQGILKDAMSRYKTMRGYYVPRIAGWDTHGLPVENEVEKQHGIKSKIDIEKIGVEKFCADCRESVFKYKEEFEKTYERIGRWVDIENGYATLNHDYMESIWWVFKRIWEKGLVYKGYKPMHISTALETPLSNFEVSLNYKDVTDFSVTAMFELEDQPGVYLLAWTTTPWTLPGNQALAINKALKYLKVKYQDKVFIVAESRLESVFKDKEYQVLEKQSADELIGKKYKPLFDYYLNIDQNYFQIVDADFVTDEGGTGIVHIAGGFGEDDYNVIKSMKLEPIIHVEMNGEFKDEVVDFAGKYVKGQDQNIGKYLEERGLLFSHENYRHSYPHCWRTDTPLLNYVTESWFIEVTKVKENMIDNNKLINWLPEHLKNGRFGKGLETAPDWSISRSRYWGCPLPIWSNQNGDVICIGSLEELKLYTDGKLPMREEKIDLHKPYIDEITFMHPDHKDSTDEKYLMKRIPDVFDCWFESGAMPYAQLHYPFENNEEFENNFPADFIIEAIDQTRGWFYTLHVLASILFDQPAFKNVVVTGHILAEDGEKLSKRKKNFVDPQVLFAEKGVDAMRMILYTSPLVNGGSVRFSNRIVEEMLKKFTLTIWNTYSFFVTYANIDKWDQTKCKSDFIPTHELDKWILSELNDLIKVSTEQMDQFNMMKATRPMLDFVDNLSNWYIRRSRRRFWKSENDQDKSSAYQTLYTVLVKFSKILAPFMPFLSEEIYTNLTNQESVHLSDWPEFEESAIDRELNIKTNVIRTIVTLGHSVRDKAKIKVRQPLSKVRIALPDNIDKSIINIYREIIAEELNVKEVEYLNDIQGIVSVVVMPNAKVLGPKYGKDVQEIIRKAKNGEFEIVDEKIKIGDYELLEGEYEIGYESEAGVDAENLNGITVILDTEVTEELMMEGFARDIVRTIQELRKDADYNVSDRIILNIRAEGKIEEAVTKFADYIARETLANELQQSGDLEWDKEKIIELEGQKVVVAVKR
ncbi:isoleucine--tRNA ligase [Candidatus Peregrinibacteria bacterium]|nr:isoleucine--tRNA ligase [Candidatus Peregrinibacteria bacterium]